MTVIESSVMDVLTKDKLRPSSVLDAILIYVPLATFARNFS